MVNTLQQSLHPLKKVVDIFGEGRMVWGMETNTNYGTLCNYKTGESIRPATREEWLASRESEASNVGGEAGVIVVDGLSVYVDGGQE